MFSVVFSPFCEQSEKIHFDGLEAVNNANISR